jgi:hypothetical protein
LTFGAVFPDLRFRMTLEAALITAISAVVGALCYFFKLLWDRSLQCEQWRKEKEPLLQEMAEKLGLLTGVARLVQDCKTSGCMFAGKIVETFSLQKLKHDLPNQNKL